MEKLYQKKHGLTGVPLIIGAPGEDGTGGNHVYFGYINDFFDVVDVSADYLVRTATGDDSIRYTGAFDDTGDPIQTVQGRYLDITSDAEFPGRYTVSNPSDNTTSREYVKADVADIGLDATGKPSPWNLSYEQNHRFRFNSSFYTDDGELWPEFQYNLFDTLIPEDREHRLMLQQIYPYVDFTGLYDGSLNNPARMKPGKYSLSQSVRGVFDLFSLTDNEIVYQFACTPATTYYDGSIYDQFYDSSLHSIDNPTIDYILGNTGHQSPVDFIKLGNQVSESVQIPDKLKEGIKAGDVIYFYTNEEQFEVDHEVEYMAVITDLLEKCSYQQLIDNAAMVNPYTFKFTSDAKADGDDYLYSTTPAVTGYYKETDEYDSIDVSAYGRNMVNMLNCLGTDTAFQIGTLAASNQDNSDVLKLIRATERQFTETLDIKARNIKNGELTILTSSSVQGKPMLKISNAYFRKNNIGNIETSLAMEPSEIILDENGTVHTPDESDINVTTGKVLLEPADYVRPSCKNWQMGIIVQTYHSDGSNVSYSPDSQSYTGSDGIFRRYEWNQDSEKYGFVLEKTFGDKTVHDIIAWVSIPGGYRKMSRTLHATFDAISGQYILNTDSKDSSNKEDGLVTFDIASISSDAAIDVPVKITFPYWNAVDEEQSYKIFINTTRITDENKTTPVKINNWCSAKWKDIELSQDNSTRTVTLLFDFKSNLPSVWEDFDTAKEYNASPGSTSTIVDGCDLFNAVISGMKIKTEQRSVNIAVNYDYATISASSGRVIDKTTHTDYTKVVQPGYSDPRRIPDVRISLPNDIRSLEDANKSSLGVMANEFQFFVEIGISGFDKSVWGSFVPEENITLDMTIRNTPFDKEFADKYSIPNPKDTRTLHVNTVSPEDDMASSANNYVRFKTYVMEPEYGSPFGKTQNTLDEYNDRAAAANMISAEDSLIVYTESGAESKTGNSVQMTTDIFSKPDERRDGIQDNITIKLKGIHFSDVADGKFRFRVVTEMSNPVFSLLFFRFYVSDLTINYKQGDLIRSFYVGQKNMKPDMQTYNGDYMFASETLRAFICPVTMTAIPEEDKVEPVSPAIMLKGSSQQISLKTGAYVPGSVIAENMSITESEKVKRFVGQQQSVGWFNFSLKKKYFQDDVTDMKLSPVRPEVMRDIITKDAVIDSGRFDEIASTDNNSGYLTVVYDSSPSILSSMKREDIMTFYYNSILYDAYGYSQKNNRKPVSTEQTGVVDVRDSALEESVTFWNRWYQDNRTASGDGLFRGIVSAYGNGYVYLNSHDGENLDVVAQKNGVYTIDDTRQKSEDNIQYSPQMGYNATRPASQPTRFISAPGSDAWFRTLLYQCQWQYPKHYTDNVTSVRYVNMYDIVTPGEYQKDSRLKIPYNVAYSLYPRCAYDTDNDMAIVFMLRCPSVVKENQYKMTKEDLRVYVENYQPLGNEKLFPAD